MQEVWKDVGGFEGEYQISSFGRLKHFSKNGWNILKNTNKKGDYFNVVLTGKSYNKSVRIHRLVAEAFIPNPENKPQVNHIDGNKQNNNVNNLEWVTAKENMLHSVRLNPNQVRPMNYYNKYIKPNKIQQFSIDGEFIKEYENAQEAHRATGVCARNILQVANKTPFNKHGNVRRQAGGFIWKLAERR